jgi:hypothetical protein
MRSSKDALLLIGGIHFSCWIRCRDKSGQHVGGRTLSLTSSSSNTHNTPKPTADSTMRFRRHRFLILILARRLIWMALQVFDDRQVQSFLRLFLGSCSEPTFAWRLCNTARRRRAWLTVIEILTATLDRAISILTSAHLSFSRIRLTITFLQLPARYLPRQTQLSIQFDADHVGEFWTIPSLALHLLK